MNEVTGDLWSYLNTHWIVIPTNVGYKSDGSNVMGAGVAKVVRDRWPKVPQWYGEFCRAFAPTPPVVTYSDLQVRLIMFPTKALNEKHPEMSWRSRSTIELVTKSAQQLAEIEPSLDAPVALPLVGCGYGGLSPIDVIPMLRKTLVSERFTLVFAEPN